MPIFWAGEIGVIEEAIAVKLAFREMLYLCQLSLLEIGISMFGSQSRAERYFYWNHDGD